MSYDEKKLIKFKEQIINDAKEKAKILEEESLKFEKEELKKVEEKYNVKALEELEKEIKNLKSEYEYKLSKKSFEIKKAILEKRNSLIEDLFAKCKQIILNFTKTEEYEEYIINKIKKYVEPSLSYKILVKISKADFRLKESIVNISEFLELEEENEIKLGGFKVVDFKKSIEFDETFDCSLENLFEDFFKNSKLNLKNF